MQKPSKQPPKHPLRAWREEQGFSLRALAAKLVGADGDPIVSYVTLQRIEAGTQEAPWDVVRKLHEISGGVLDANQFMIAVRGDGKSEAGHAG